MKNFRLTPTSTIHEKLEWRSGLNRISQLFTNPVAVQDFSYSFRPPLALPFMHVKQRRRHTQPTIITAIYSSRESEQDEEQQKAKLI